MKCLAGICLLFLVLSVVRADDLGEKKQFDDFINRFGKKYQSEEEYLHRFEIFKASVERVQRLNDPTLGITKFSDLTPEEFAEKFVDRVGSSLIGCRYRGGLKGNPVGHPTTAQRMRTSRAPTRTIREANGDTFDWRDFGVIGPVKDLVAATCPRGCWAFAAVALVETDNALNTAKYTALSEQNLIDCDTSEMGCSGGLLTDALQFVVANGIFSQSCYPYEGSQGACQTKSCSSVSIPGWDSISTYESDMSLSLLIGPIAVSMNSVGLQDYTGGVYDPSETACPGSTTDHAAVIVGYGTDSTGRDYWIVRNCWGKDWGESGYLRIARGTGACGINKYPVIVSYA